MDTQDKVRCANGIHAMAATMNEDGSMHLAFVYGHTNGLPFIHGPANGYMLADLPSDLAGRVLDMITDALLEAEWRGAVETRQSVRDSVSATASGGEVA
ncbi:hypothetical protein [Nocardia sp. NPDC020380]|uniref:hypothetical protein n=1 Tax=Nocardia sp. NPDC020380 TaxID=3364309 RepID=UPI0037A59092